MGGQKLFILSDTAISLFIESLIEWQLFIKT